MTTNPALVDAAGLVGHWKMHLYNAAFLPGPDARVVGSATVDWIEDGSALVMRQGDASTTPSATWIIGRDEGEPDFLAFYADDRGVSRIYRMSLQASDWRIWRDAPGFSQRFSARIDPDGHTIRGQWEKSSDEGKTWEHDFDLHYIRTAAS